jgi:hypothetical protein
MAIGQNALDFLNKEATQDEKGNYHVTQKKYQEFMNSCGVTKEVAEAVNAAQSEYVNGLRAFNAAKIKEAAAAQIKAGKSVEEVSITTTTNTAGGMAKATTFLKKSYPKVGTDEKIDKYGVFQYKQEVKRLIDKDSQSATEAELEKFCANLK